MNAVNVLAEALGAILVLTGLTATNKSYIHSVLSDWQNSKGQTWLVGVLTFFMGVVTVALYNIWSSDWHVVITVIGWLMIIKGAYIALFPNTSMKMYRKVGANSMVVIAGVIAVVVGLVLFYLGLAG